MMNIYGKNRPLQQKSNPNVYLKLIESVYLDKKKDQRLNLPKIAPSKEPSHAKKTLIALVKRLQVYIEQNENQVPDTLKQCLFNLKEHLNQQKVIMARAVAQRSTANHQQLNNDSYPQFITGEMPRKSEDTWVSRSQVMNIKRTNLKKVENRQLFQKVRTVKYEHQQTGNFSSVNEKQMINILKNRVKEKDNTIRQLHQHIECLNAELEEIKNTLTNKNQGYEVLFKENQKLTDENISFTQKLQSLQDKLNIQKSKKASAELSDLQTLKVQLKDSRNQCIHIRAKLQERQDQLTALWQTYLSGSYKCIL